MSRHCTSGRPASIITENCRVNTARFFAETFFPSLPGLALRRGRVGLRLGRRDPRDEDLLAPERGDRRVHRVGARSPLTVCPARVRPEYAKVGMSYLRLRFLIPNSQFQFQDFTTAGRAAPGRGPSPAPAHDARRRG